MLFIRKFLISSDLSVAVVDKAVPCSDATGAGNNSASGIAAELGIPLTHRGVATSVRFLTGNSRKGGIDPLFVAESSADPNTTLVVYMGLGTLPSLAQKLMCHGLLENTTAAAVERGTTPHQRVVFAEMKDLAKEIESAALVSPTLIIIGKVVTLSPYRPHCSKESVSLVEAKWTFITAADI